MTAEFVIVGGGIYGAATAWALARGGAEVVVLEARGLAAGASGGVGKRGVRANGRDLRELPLMRAAHALWPTLDAVLGAPTGYERIGHMQLYERHHDAGAADVRARVQSAMGVPTRHLGGDEARDLEPGLSPKVLGALHAPGDGVADHEATTRAYAAAAVRAGAVVRTGAPVVALERRGDRVDHVVLGDGEVVRVGRTLILLNNGGLQALAYGLGLHLPVWTIYPQVVCSTPAAVAPFRAYVGHVHRPVALKMIPGGSVMLSGGWRGRMNPETGLGETIPASVTGNWAEAVALFPALGALQIAEAVADRPETNCLDLVPVVDRVPGVSNTFLACGWTGHGWALAPALALELATWARDGECPDVLRPFALSRFPAASLSPAAE